MYDNTQAKLAALGFKPDDTIRLYRGVNLPQAQAYAVVREGVKVHGNPLESWTTSPYTAMGFGEDRADTYGVVLTADVPVRDIVSTPLSGTGCMLEYEVVIKGGISRPATAQWPDALEEEIRTEVMGGKAKGNPVDLDVSDQADWIKEMPGYAQERRFYGIQAGGKQFEPVQGQGDPLPEDEALKVAFTAQDVAEAVKLWDLAQREEEPKGLIMAHKATAEEEAEILSGGV
jgi:hypothetical protein